MSEDTRSDGGTETGSGSGSSARTRATFEGIDWESVDSTSAEISGVTLVQAGFYLVWLALLLYDAFVLPRSRPTVSWWDVTAVEWVFVLVLAAAAFNVAVPLYQNTRMTRYYWSQFRKNKAAVASLGFLAVVFVVGLVGPALLKPPQLVFSDAYLPPVGMTASPTGQAVTGTWEHPLGTDAQGRDLLKLVVLGMRVSMEVGLITMAIAISIGTLVGTVAAHFGGMVDEALMRYVDLQQSFPAFILLLLLVYLFGGSLIIFIAVYGVLSWEATARLVRSEALQRTEAPYIQAAEAAGASRLWIIRRHIIPNVSGTVITNATLLIPGYILAEAGLSFLGLGDPNVFSWGQIIAAGRGDLANAPWIATVPGVFLFFTILAFNFVGDALNDAIDPRRSQ
jgi:peptide/nickel transport system permease protein